MGLPSAGHVVHRGLCLDIEDVIAAWVSYTRGTTARWLCLHGTAAANGAALTCGVAAAWDTCLPRACEQVPCAPRLLVAPTHSTATVEPSAIWPCYHVVKRQQEVPGCWGLYSLRPAHV